MELEVKGIKLVEGDRLNFNIYHGTSSRNLESILKKGFGNKDPELFDRNLFIRLAMEIKKYSSTSKFWQSYEYIINKIIDNSGRFTYDNMHFSPSRNIACQYAINFQGSEYLFTIKMMVEELNQLNNGKGNEIISSNQKIQDYFMMPHQPILVTWQKPLLSQLGAEGNLSLAGVENNIKLMAKSSILPTFEANALVTWGQIIFLSKNVLKPKDILIEKLLG